MQFADPCFRVGACLPRLQDEHARPIRGGVAPSLNAGTHARWCACSGEWIEYLWHNAIVVVMFQELLRMSLSSSWYLVASLQQSRVLSTSGIICVRKLL